jgi:hypothetical protein
MRKAADAFSSCQAAGLFALAASNPDTPLSPTFAYWRDFAPHYLTQLRAAVRSALPERKAGEAGKSFYAVQNKDKGAFSDKDGQHQAPGLSGGEGKSCAWMEEPVKGLRSFSEIE